MLKHFLPPFPFDQRSELIIFHGYAVIQITKPELASAEIVEEDVLWHCYPAKTAGGQVDQAGTLHAPAPTLRFLEASGTTRSPKGYCSPVADVQGHLRMPPDLMSIVAKDL